MERKTAFYRHSTSGIFNNTIISEFALEVSTSRANHVYLLLQDTILQVNNINPTKGQHHSQPKKQGYHSPMPPLKTHLHQPPTLPKPPSRIPPSQCLTTLPPLGVNRHNSNNILHLYILPTRTLRITHNSMNDLSCTYTVQECCQKTCPDRAGLVLRMHEET